MSDLTIIKFEVLGMLFSPFAALGLVACLGLLPFTHRERKSEWLKSGVRTRG